MITAILFVLELICIDRMFKASEDLDLPAMVGWILMVIITVVFIIISIF